MSLFQALTIEPSRSGARGGLTHLSRTQVPGNPPPPTGFSNPAGAYRGTIGTGAQRDSGMLLQASRRVDWRFLLPDPELGRVGYVGPARKPLVEALRQFSASLTVLSRDQAPGSREFEVVVAVEPSFRTIEQAVQWLRPNGWLYVEAHGPALHGPLRIARDYSAALRRLGMSNVEAYWHWPNFESCTEIVPLGEKAALSSVLERHRSGPSERLKSALGRWLLRGGLLAHVIPYFSIVGRRRSQS